METVEPGRGIAGVASEGAHGAQPAAATGSRDSRRTLYVWDLSVRITHWVNVLCIVVLSVTGYYIASPFIITQGEATNQFLMGFVRFVHITTAFVFTMSVLFRIYWAFAGRKYARWTQFVPASRGRWRDLGRMARYYTYFRREPPAEVGHNPLAGITYIGLYALFSIQMVTGFALYSQPYHDGWLKVLFGWVIVVWGAQPVRLVHGIIMYLIIAFTIHHVYSAVLIDIEERSGLVSSIITGRKSLPQRTIEEAEASESLGARRRWARFASSGKASVPDEH
jgi:Ni/Fe-hydrogenase 1 B-type cytochrome subunit